jgi:cyclic pyranopterin phosphate synthase
MATVDAFGRALGSLRISVTDRCNLRCAYCMPEESYTWLPKPDVLTFEELRTVVRAFVRLGLSKVRLTGGEPLLRRDLPHLVAMLAAEPLSDLALTSNGVLLREQAAALRDAGLGRLTVSLDTLRPERFTALTRRDGLGAVLDGIEAALAAGFAELKLDTVVLRGTNDDELGDLLRFARARGAELRFIEYMDVGGATQWSSERVVSRAEILARVEAELGPARLAAEPRLSSPAERFVLEDGTAFGIIASTTAPFCGACDRARLTADGRLLACLYAHDGIDLRGLLRSGCDEEALAARLAAFWSERRDRGAEQRLALEQRGPLVPVERLRRSPHLEMHTRGG